MYCWVTPRTPRWPHPPDSVRAAWRSGSVWNRASTPYWGPRRFSAARASLRPSPRVERVADHRVTDQGERARAVEVHRLRRGGEVEERRPGLADEEAADRAVRVAQAEQDGVREGLALEAVRAVEVSLEPDADGAEAGGRAGLDAEAARAGRQVELRVEVLALGAVVGRDARQECRPVRSSRSRPAGPLKSSVASSCA